MFWVWCNAYATKYLEDRESGEKPYYILKVENSEEV